MKIFVLVLVSVACLAPVGSAQTPVAGSSRCGKPDPAHTLPAGDRPDHSYGIVKMKCLWVKALEMGGARMKEDEITSFSEVTGNSSSDHGFVVGTLSSGDKVFVRTQGKSVLANGLPQSNAGTWTYAGGTGKLKGITGKGTFSCKSNPDGTSGCDVAGGYQLPRLPQ